AVALAAPVVLPLEERDLERVAIVVAQRRRPDAGAPIGGGGGVGREAEGQRAEDEEGVFHDRFSFAAASCTKEFVMSTKNFVVGDWPLAVGRTHRGSLSTANRQLPTTRNSQQDHPVTPHTCPHRKKTG